MVLRSPDICEECEDKIRKSDLAKTKEYWCQLSPPQQQVLCEVDKAQVVRELKAHHKHTCACPTCGKRRTMFDAEVKVFEEYVKELEYLGRISEDKRRTYPVSSDAENQDNQSRISHRDDLPFGQCLVIESGKITLTSDYFQDNGKKFADLMDSCCDLYPEDFTEHPYPIDFHTFSHKARRLYSDNRGSDSDTEEDCDSDAEDCSVSDEGSNDYSSDTHDEDEDTVQTVSRKMREYRLQETTLFFQVYVARLFANNVKVAYKEVVARKNQMNLLADLEREEEENKIKEKKRQEKRTKKKESKKNEQQREKDKATDEDSQEQQKHTNKDNTNNNKTIKGKCKEVEVEAEKEEKKEKEVDQAEQQRREEQRRLTKQRREEERKRKEEEEKRKEKVKAKAEKKAQKVLQKAKEEQYRIEQAKQKEAQKESKRQKKEERRKKREEEQRKQELIHSNPVPGIAPSNTTTTTTSISNTVSSNSSSTTGATGGGGASSSAILTTSDSVDSTSVTTPSTPAKKSKKKKQQVQTPTTGSTGGDPLTASSLEDTVSSPKKGGRGGLVGPQQGVHVMQPPQPHNRVENLQHPHQVLVVSPGSAPPDQSLIRTGSLASIPPPGSTSSASSVWGDTSFGSGIVVGAAPSQSSFGILTESVSSLSSTQTSTGGGPLHAANSTGNNGTPTGTPTTTTTPTIASPLHNVGYIAAGTGGNNNQAAGTSQQQVQAVTVVGGAVGGSTSATNQQGGQPVVVGLYNALQGVVPSSTPPPVTAAPNTPTSAGIHLATALEGAKVVPGGINVSGGQQGFKVGTLFDIGWTTTPVAAAPPQNKHQSQQQPALAVFGGNRAPTGGLGTTTTPVVNSATVLPNSQPNPQAVRGVQGGGGSGNGVVGSGFASPSDASFFGKTPRGGGGAPTAASNTQAVVAAAAHHPHPPPGTAAVQAATGQPHQQGGAAGGSGAVAGGNNKQKQQPAAYSNFGGGGGGLLGLGGLGATAAPPANTQQSQQVGGQTVGPVGPVGSTSSPFGLRSPFSLPFNQNF